jgi:membrane-associated protease RseP (regulator of RpoE activity)
MGFKEVFSLSKNKILVDFLISVLMIIIIGLNPAFLYRLILLTKPLYWQIGWILINLFVSMIIYYPLSCGLLFVYERIFRKKKKVKKNSLIIAILVILILNPLTFSLAYGQIVNNRPVISGSCNLIVTGFTDNSPALVQGMQIGEILLEVNGYEITSLDSLTHSLADKRKMDSVIVKTNIKEYDITTTGEANSERAMLGIKVENFCGL